MTSISLVRRIAARPSIVFDLLATPEGIPLWWGPDDGPVLIAESDFRPGGKFRVRFRDALGDEHETSGEFLEIVRPVRVVMSWSWLGGVEDPGESRVEFDLAEAGEGTTLTLTHSRLYEEATGLTHQTGWIGALDKLARHFDVA
jgi:uncharacterized protein YndB with AHSA1/START domain